MDVDEAFAYADRVDKAFQGNQEPGGCYAAVLTLAAEVRRLRQLYYEDVLEGTAEGATPWG